MALVSVLMVLLLLPLGTAHAGLKFVPNKTSPEGEFKVPESDAAPEADGKARPAEEPRAESPQTPPVQNPPAATAPEESKPDSGPGWYRKRKKEKEAEAASDALKQTEVPIVGSEPATVKPPDAGSPSPPAAAPVSDGPAKEVPDVKEVVKDVEGAEPSTAAKPYDPSTTVPAQTLGASEIGGVRDVKTLETNLLFKKPGLTDSLTLDLGGLFQKDINGPALSLSYAMGWWWRPDLVASGFARILGNYSGEHVFFMAMIGPQFRYFARNNWVFGAQVGYAYSMGLTKVEASHIPVPPDAEALSPRRGFMLGLSASKFSWVRRDMGYGPTFTGWVGNQDERLVIMLMVGFTYQSGKPNYTGDLTLDAAPVN